MDFKLECPTCRRALPAPAASVLREIALQNNGAASLEAGDIV